MLSTRINGAAAYRRKFRKIPERTVQNDAQRGRESDTGAETRARRTSLSWSTRIACIKLVSGEKKTKRKKSEWMVHNELTKI